MACNVIWNIYCITIVIMFQSRNERINTAHLGNGGFWGFHKCWVSGANQNDCKWLTSRQREANRKRQYDVVTFVNGFVIDNFLNGRMNLALGNLALSPFLSLNNWVILTKSLVFVELQEMKLLPCKMKQWDRLRKLHSTQAPAPHSCARGSHD